MTQVKGILLRLSPETIERLDAARKAVGVPTRTKYLRQVLEAHLNEIDISASVREDEVADVPITHQLAGARRSRRAASGGAASAGPGKDHAGHSGRASCPVTPASDPAEGSGKAGSSTPDEEIEF